MPAALKPVPVHEDALIDDHERVADCPGAIMVGFAVKDAAGTFETAVPDGTMWNFAIPPWKSAVDIAPAPERFRSQLYACCA